MPTKKTASKAIQNPEALNVHANMLQEVAWFIGEREYLKSPTWDADSERLGVTLSALKEIRRRQEIKPDAEAFDLAALHGVSRLDVEDADPERLEAVRVLVVELLSATPEEFAKRIAGLSFQDQLDAMQASIEGLKR